MKRSFKLNGLSCAQCASKIEEGISALTGVTGVTMNFATTKLTIECDDEGGESIIEAAKALVLKVEPDIEIVRG